MENRLYKNYSMNNVSFPVYLSMGGLDVYRVFVPLVNLLVAIGIFQKTPRL